LLVNLNQVAKKQSRFWKCPAEFVETECEAFSVAMLINGRYVFDSAIPRGLDWEDVGGYYFFSKNHKFGPIRVEGVDLQDSRNFTKALNEIVKYSLYDLYLYDIQNMDTLDSFVGTVDSMGEVGSTCSSSLSIKLTEEAHILGGEGEAPIGFSYYMIYDDVRYKVEPCE